MKCMNIGKSTWEWGTRTYIMGILNVTPDSFSDGGKYTDIDAAVKHALHMQAEGADIIDVGGESTRPGSVPVTEEEEKRRVIPVIEELVKVLDIPISVDTYRAGTAELALKAGASMINDVWGLKYDPEMASLAADRGVCVCIMHNRSKGPVYDNLIEDMIAELSESIEIAKKSGIKDEKIIIDPGIGFAKTSEHNLMIMRNLDRFKKLGYPLLLAASRKRFIGEVLGLDVNDRIEGTLAVTAAGIMKGVDMVRVHDVLENKRVAKMMDSMVR